MRNIYVSPMEELSSKWEKFKLSEEEQFAIEIRESTQEDCCFREKCSAIGSYFFDRRISLDVIRSNMLKVFESR